VAGIPDDAPHEMTCVCNLPAELSSVHAADGESVLNGLVGNDDSRADSFSPGAATPPWCSHVTTVSAILLIVSRLVSCLTEFSADLSWYPLTV
jgi:hypothetical protein